jgi:hypothetical protein
MVEIMKRRIINARFIPAIIEPIIVNQFLEDGGSFIGPVKRLMLSRGKNRKILDYPSMSIYLIL